MKLLWKSRLVRSRDKSDVLAPYFSLDIKRDLASCDDRNIRIISEAFVGSFFFFSFFGIDNGCHQSSQLDRAAKLGPSTL